MPKSGRAPQAGLGLRDCIVCGTEFQPYRAHQIACSRACREKSKGQNPLLKEHEFTCKRCGEPFTAMWSGRGAQPSCPDCTAKIRRAKKDRMNASRREGGHLVEVARVRQRKYNLRKYKLTAEQFAEMFEAQGGVCAICGNGVDPDGIRSTANLHVDHNHVTGKIRGLLCHGCNQGIGRFKDDPERLMAAARYLKEHTHERAARG